MVDPGALWRDREDKHRSRIEHKNHKRTRTKARRRRWTGRPVGDLTGRGAGQVRSFWPKSEKIARLPESRITHGLSCRGPRAQTHSGHGRPNMLCHGAYLPDPTRDGRSRKCPKIITKEAPKGYKMPQSRQSAKRPRGPRPRRGPDKDETDEIRGSLDRVL